MILVDSRAGSDELLKPLLKLGLPAEETLLDYGDIAFLGKGEGGKQLFIGVEHKRVSDLVQSLSTGRLAGHQLPGMVQTYDRIWLIIEGEWQADEHGSVTMWRGGRGRRGKVRGSPPAVELEKRILGLEIRGGIHVRHCPTRADTVRFLFALYRWWTDKDLDAHRSHLAIHAPDMDRGLAIPISDFRAIVAQVPGIGLARSQAVEVAFGGSFRRMMLATPQQWADIRTVDRNGKSKRLGESTAQKILEALS